MELDIANLLNSIDPLLIFTVLAFGLLLGKVQLLGFSLGATAGVLLVGLGFGYLGFEITPQSESLGFMLFIFCVGIEAGPNFFSTFAKDGPRFILLSLSVIVAGGAAAMVAARFLELDSELVAGMFAGALTSTPSLVGAQDAILTRMPELSVSDREGLISRLSSAYAVSYVVGMFAIILIMRYLPRLLKIDLPEESRQLALKRGLFQPRRVVRTPIIRAYKADSALIEQLNGKTLREIGVFERFGLRVESLKRNGKVFHPNSELVLELDDRFALVGYPSAHSKADLIRAQEIYDPDLLEFEINSVDVIVTNTFALGKSLNDLGLEANWGCFAFALFRGQMEMPLNRSTPLGKGDILSLSGEKGRLQELVEEIGFARHQNDISDLVVFSSFFILGLLLGQFKMLIGTTVLSLGNAGGLLVAGILMGYLRANHPTIGHVPQGALNMLKDLGLNIFMVSVGLSAGVGIVDTLVSSGSGLILASIMVTFFALLFGYIVGTYVLRMNVALLLGAITGAMTSTPAMGILNEMSKSNVPALGYVGTYAIANILLTLVGTMLVLM